MLQISIFSFSDHIETSLTSNICIYLYGHQKIVYSWGFLAATNPAVSITTHNASRLNSQQIESQFECVLLSNSTAKCICTIKKPGWVASLHFSDICCHLSIWHTRFSIGKRFWYLIVFIMSLGAFFNIFINKKFGNERKSKVLFFCAIFAILGQ